MLWTKWPSRSVSWSGRQTDDDLSGHVTGFDQREGVAGFVERVHVTHARIEFPVRHQFGQYGEHPGISAALQWSSAVPRQYVRIRHAEDPAAANLVQGTDEIEYGVCPRRILIMVVGNDSECLQVVVFRRTRCPGHLDPSHHSELRGDRAHTAAGPEDQQALAGF